MRKSKIEWTEYTWNPVTGCYHTCGYCYARTLTKRFAGDVRLNLSNSQCVCVKDGSQPLYELTEPFKATSGRTISFPFGFTPTLHKYRLDWLDNLKTGARVFVCSVADLFGEWVPDKWIESVFSACDKYPRHHYLFLTKNPKKYYELLNAGKLSKKSNMWYGYSYTKRGCETFTNREVNTFVSMEPLLEDIADDFFFDGMGWPNPNWVIIGAETGQNRNKVIPKIEWINKILKYCDNFNIPVFMKDSLISIVGEENMRREIPDEMKQTVLSEKREQKLCTDCYKCKKHKKKSEMTAISIRKGRRGEAKTIAYACDNCMPEFLKGLGINDGEVK